MKLPGLHNELDLIRLVTEGDEHAFRRIFDHYNGKLYNYALRITDKEELAEEIVMDAFLKIWINRAALGMIESFDGYLYTVVRNQAFNAIKRMAHESNIMKELTLNNTEYNHCTDETVIYNDYQQLLHKAVNQLPAQQKLVYILSKDEGLRYDEIADQLKLSKNTVKTHLKKAVSTLRTVFTNYMAIAISIYFLF